MNVRFLVEEIRDEVISIRRDFHMNPELGGKEYRTMNKICEYLRSWNIEYKQNVAETGVVAIIRGKNSGKTVGIRADMDALPIKEEASVDYKSLIDGRMHACGHDGHLAIALGAAKILKSMEANLNGNIKFFFQPAEETIGGAERMIKEGCLENPRVDYVIGLHIDTSIPTGTIGIKYGKMMAASDEIKIIIRGASTHGAHPHKGIDPIYIASNIVMSLQSIVSRNISPTNSAVFTIGSIHGGRKGNVIPDEVVLTGILRTLDEDTRIFMKNRIKTLVNSISLGLGGRSEIFINESYGPLINDDSLVDLVKTVARRRLGEDKVIIREFPSMGTEDFSYFAKAVKSCFYNLGCRNEEKNAIYPAHSSRFTIDEDCLLVGVMLQVENALELLKM